MRPEKSTRNIRLVELVLGQQGEVSKCSTNSLDFKKICPAKCLPPIAYCI